MEQLRDLLISLHERKRVDGKPVSKTAAAAAIGVSRATLQAWHTEGDWWQPPGWAHLKPALDYYEATDDERALAMQLRVQLSTGDGEAA